MSNNVFRAAFARKGSLKCLVIVLAVLLAGCQKAEEKAAASLQQGIELYKQGDFKKAQLAFRTAIQTNASLAEPYYYMALLYEKDSNYKAMRENLAQAINFDPTHLAARLKLGNVLLALNEADAAAEQAAEVLKLQADSADAQVLQAAALLRQKKPNEAMAMVDGVLQKSPNFSSASALKAVILMESKQFDAALALVVSALATDADNLELYLIKVRLDSRRQAVDEVIADYQKLVALQPDNVEFKITLAKIYVAGKRTTEADALLQQLVSSNPERDNLKLAYLDFLKINDPQNAIAQLQAYATASNNKPEQSIVFAQWLFANQQIDEAEKLLESSLAANPSPEQAEKLQLTFIEMQLSNKAYDAGLQRVDALLAQNNTLQAAKLLKARLHLAKKEYDPAVELLNKVLWESPELDSVVVMLAQIELLKHEPDKADKKFREALEINPANTDALQAVIQRTLGQGNVGYAVDFLTKALQYKPDNVALSSQLAQMQLLKKDWAAAKLAIDTLEKNPNAQADVVYLRAKAEQAQGRCEQAIEGYKKLLKEVPSYVDALDGLAQCAQQTQRNGELVGYLGSYLAENPSFMHAYVLKSQLEFLTNNSSAAVATLKQALSVNKRDASVFGALAEIYLRKQDYNSAFSYYQQGLAESPEQPALMQGMAQAYEQAGDYKQAVIHYEQLLEKYPELDVAANNLATLLIDRFNDPQSHTKAISIAERFKNAEQAYFLDTYGWVEAQAGDISKAISTLEKVNVMAPQVPVFKYHLGVAYSKQGNKAGAAAQLQEALSLAQQNEPFAERKQAQQLLDKLTIAK